MGGGGVAVIARKRVTCESRIVMDSSYLLGLRRRRSSDRVSVSDDSRRGCAPLSRQMPVAAALPQRQANEARRVDSASAHRHKHVTWLTPPTPPPSPRGR